MNRPGIRPLRNDINMKEKYNEQYKRYISGEFTYNSLNLIKRLSENGGKEPNMMKMPLYKIITEIAKIMMMNELELLFFGSTIQEMKWKIIEGCLNEYIEEITDITPNIAKDPSDPYVKKVQLSLLLIAYIVKIYLNEDSSVADYKIREIVSKQFDKMYQAWVQKVQSHFKFNPKNMNRLFKEVDKTKKIKKAEIVDYNRLVQEFFRDTNSKGFGNIKDQQNEEQKEDDPNEQIQLPQFPYQNRSIQNSRYPISRRQPSGFGFQMTKRESMNQLLPVQSRRAPPLMRNFSADSEFMGKQ